MLELIPRSPRTATVRLVLAGCLALTLAAPAIATPEAAGPAVAPDPGSRQADAAPASEGRQADAPSPFIGFVATLGEETLTASNVPVTAPPAGEPRVMVLRRDGSAVSTDEGDFEIVRNPDGTLSVKRRDDSGGESTAAGAEADPASGDDRKIAVTPAGEAGAAATSSAGEGAGAGAAASSAGEDTGAGEKEQQRVVVQQDDGEEGAGATGIKWTAAGDAASGAPASDEPLQFVEFVIDDDTEIVGELAPGVPIRVEFEEVDERKVARKIEVVEL